MVDPGPVQAPAPDRRRPGVAGAPAEDVSRYLEKAVVPTDEAPLAEERPADIAETLLFETERIKTSLCDQSNAAQLRAFASEYGPFDIIIDDGSHLADHQTISFFALFDFVRPGGYYLIEDVAEKDLSLDPFYNPSPAFQRLVDPVERDNVLRQVQYCANYSLNGSGFGYDNPNDDHFILFRKNEQVPQAGEGS